jgi:hypothetical protein
LPASTSTNVRRSLLEARSEAADRSKSRSPPGDSMPLPLGSGTVQE